MVFYFWSRAKHEGYCQPITASTFSEAREKMFKEHGTKWAFQYSESEWKDIVKGGRAEKELPTIIVEDE
jgi:hypothetical protein